MQNKTTTDKGSMKLFDQLRSNTSSTRELLLSTLQPSMMKIITWNIRGLNGKSKQRILPKCIKSEDPFILLLQETKCFTNIAEEIFKRCWHTCNHISTDANRAVGSLSIL
jgi:hypothetical protein